MGQQSGPEPSADIDTVADALQRLDERVARLDARERATAEEIGQHAQARRTQAAIGPIVVLAVAMFAPFIEVKVSADGPDPTDHFSVLGLLWAVIEDDSRRNSDISQSGAVVIVALLLAVIAAVGAGWAVASTSQEPSRRARLISGWSTAVGIVALIVARAALPGKDDDLDVSLQFGSVALVCGFLWAAAVADSERRRDDYR